MAKPFESMGEFLQAAARELSGFATKAAPLSEIDSLWNVAQGGARLVFQP